MKSRTNISVARLFYYQNNQRSINCHFRNKLDADQPDFILRIVITQFIHRVIYFVCCRLLEVIINIVQMVFIHNFLQEVINIQLGS